MAESGRRKGAAALLTALAADQTVRDAARDAGMGERTAGRRLAEPDFRRRVAELRAGMIGRALGKLADGMTGAAGALRQLLTASADTVKLGAAPSILELGNKLRESVELEERLQALEQRFGEKRGCVANFPGSCKFLAGKLVDHPELASQWPGS